MFGLCFFFSLLVAISDPDPGSRNGLGVPGFLSKHAFARSWIGLSFSVMPAGDFGQPQDVVLFDPDTAA